MQAHEQRAILAIALGAAFSDDSRGEQERDELRRVAAALQPGPEFNLPALVQDAVLGRIDIDAMARELGSAQLRQIAFEFAVGVCDADGLRNPAETRFLADLGRALGLTQPQMVEPAANTDAIVTAPLVTAPPGASAGADEAVLDRMILDTAI